MHAVCPLPLLRKLLVQPLAPHRSFCFSSPATTDCCKHTLAHQHYIPLESTVTMASALPSHLRPASNGGGEGDKADFAKRHHGKTQSHVVSTHNSCLLVGEASAKAWPYTCLPLDCEMLQWAATRVARKGQDCQGWKLASHKRPVHLPRYYEQGSGD